MITPTPKVCQEDDGLLSTAQDESILFRLAESPPKAQAARNAEQPGVFPHAGNAGAPTDTREAFAHTQRLPEHGSARLQLRETRALAKREEKTITLGAHFFLYELL